MPNTDAVAPPVQPYILSSSPPSRAQKRLALVVLLGIVVIVAIVKGPLSHLRTSPVPAFVPIYVTTMIATDAITAVLLFTQFAILRSRGILVIAIGYAYAALMLIPYLLTFPGLFGAAGVLDGALSTAWFFILWRTGFPLFVIGYALLKNSNTGDALSRSTSGATVVLSVTFAASVVVAAVLLNVFSDAYLPAMLRDALASSTWYPYVVGGPVLVVSSLAILVLWLRRSSVLDLWLTVVMCLFAMEVPLSFWPNPIRFSISWYTFRGVGIIASSLILMVLLYEITTLYGRLFRAIDAQRHEREARLLTGDAVAAAIAHEVRQPLSAIVTSAGAGLRFLERSTPALDKAIESLRRITADGHRADDVIESVRATFKKGVRERIALDVNQLIQETIAFESDDLRKHKILVRLAPTAGLPDIYGDRVQLQQVLLNLITNAIHAMAARDEPRVLSVTSEADVEGGGVLISVADTGLGVDPQNVNRVFNPLFTTKSDGMGMGLAICRSIVEAHDGRLWVTRNAPHGAVFQFTLRP
ncbi:MAG TPA: MASE4 domain-containing protein [Vicinamibacterales bacterium]|jgi:signal transduction histidine kinase